MVGDRPTRSRAPQNYNEDRPLEDFVNPGIYSDSPRATAAAASASSASGSSRNGRASSASGLKIKLNLGNQNSRRPPPPPSSDEHREQDDNAEQHSDDDLDKDSEYQGEKPAMRRELRNRAPLAPTHAPSSSHPPEARRGSRNHNHNNGHHLNTAPHPSHPTDHSRAPPPPRPSSSSGRRTRNSAQQIKSEHLVYPNVDGQGRSQAQIDPNLHPEEADVDGDYVGEPQADDDDDDDDDADASGEPDYEVDEEADPMNLQPGDVLDVPPLSASQEDAEGEVDEDQEEEELSECFVCFCFSLTLLGVLVGMAGAKAGSCKTSTLGPRTDQQSESSSRQTTIVHSAHPIIIITSDYPPTPRMNLLTGYIVNPDPETAFKSLVHLDDDRRRGKYDRRRRSTCEEARS